MPIKLPSFEEAAEGGHIRLTQRIAIAMQRDEATGQAVTEAIGRYLSGDYGDLPAADKQQNEQDIQSGTGHILGAYKTPSGRIYINAELYRGDITPFCVMFCDEW